MTRHSKPDTGPWGKPLSSDAKKLVTILRDRLTTNDVPISNDYNTDFNLYRWIFNAERTTKHKSSAEIIEMAYRALKNHLAFRALLNLDDENIPTWDENILYTEKYLPRGHIAPKPDKYNRLLWYLEYRSLTFDRMIQNLSTHQIVFYQFYMYEYMLRLVMEQEKKTGTFSAVRHIVDMDGYNMSPMNMLFVNNGSVAYYGQLLHYEHFPELVSPSELMNCVKLLTIPYRLVRGVMPHGFADRFKLHSNKNTEGLLCEIDADNIPSYLGGTNNDMVTIECDTSVKLELDPNNPNEVKRESSVSQPNSRHPTVDGEDDDIFTDAPSQLTDSYSDDTRMNLVIHARRRKIVPVEVTHEKTTLGWHFTTDADIFFGVYYQPNSDQGGPIADLKKLDTDTLDMKYPYMKLGARIVAEEDSIECSEIGTYYFVFCNRMSWLHRRNVDLSIRLQTQPLRISRERIMSL